MSEDLIPALGVIVRSTKIVWLTIRDVMAALCSATIRCTRLLVHLVDGDLADSIEGGRGII
jgi:hypothetical protein